MTQKTSIVSTLGPASASREVISQLIAAGVSTFRLNFSHGTFDDHQAILNHINEARAKLPYTISVMGDLCGPKIRTGLIESGTVLVENSTVSIAVGDDIGNGQAFSTGFADLINEVQVGERILIDDGQLVLSVVDKKTDRLSCNVLVGGPLSSRKGMNLPDTHLSVPAITEKDWRCVDWAIEKELDFLSLSFVQRAEEIIALKDYIKKKDSSIKVIAKIEKPLAVENIESIIQAADAIMVARGDLGVEMDLAEVPLVQKKITALCRRFAKPVIVATQVLQSMIENASPTRAEATDISNAVMEYADAVMLSGETAVGKYPVAAVKTLAHICRTTEQHLDAAVNEHLHMEVGPEWAERATIARSAAFMLDEIKVKYVVMFSRSGVLARLLSKSRIDVPVLSMTDNRTLAGQLALYYGVISVYAPASATYQGWIETVEKTVLDNGWAVPGDKILLIPPLEVLSKNTSGAIIMHTIV